MGETVISEDEFARFGRDGFVVKRAMFDSDEIGLLKAACAEDEELARHTFQQADPDGRKFVVTAWNHPGDDLYGMVARCERVVGAMERFLGGEVYHYHSKIIWKRPGDGAFVWHQDYGYWYENGLLYPDLASCSIAIDPADRENGCLRYIRGSHRLGRIDHVQVGGQSTVERGRLTEVLKVLDVVYCEMEPGDAVFHHCNTIHGSEANTSDRGRLSMVCCYNAASNNSYKEHHHPRYTPLHKVPDAAIKAAGRRLSESDKGFIDPAKVEHAKATFESAG